jgi:lipase maturation factor 1
LQIRIVITGNYAFFNLLSIALCLFLFDDATLARFIPESWVVRASKPDRAFVPLRARRTIAACLTVLIVLLSSLFFVQALRGDLPASARALVSIAAPFGITSSYGLFATMTTTRPEIIIEGSNDGKVWLTYEFPYKPGRLDRSPPWVAPHPPRLDWQMWFAALGNYQENVWFLNLLARLLQGSPDVLARFEYNPFPVTPPRLIRAELYEYRFTDWDTRRKTGHWWARTPLRPYVPAVSLQNLSMLPLFRSRDERDR